MAPSAHFLHYWPEAWLRPTLFPADIIVSGAVEITRIQATSDDTEKFASDTLLTTLGNGEVRGALSLHLLEPDTSELTVPRLCFCDASAELRGRLAVGREQCAEAHCNRHRPE